MRLESLIGFRSSVKIGKKKIKEEFIEQENQRNQTFE